MSNLSGNLQSTPHTKTRKGSCLLKNEPARNSNLAAVILTGQMVAYYFAAQPSSPWLWHCAPAASSQVSVQLHLMFPGSGHSWRKVLISKAVDNTHNTMTITSRFDYVHTAQIQTVSRTALSVVFPLDWSREWMGLCIVLTYSTSVAFYIPTTLIFSATSKIGLAALETR